MVYFAGAAGGDAASAASSPVREVPVIREDHYTMNARVRPLLLFWISRDDVGGARITWRSGADGRHGFEMLVGSDPARAPRKINRWGFIAEDVSGGTTDVLSFMKDSGEQTLKEADATTAVESTDRVPFSAVRTVISGSKATSGLLAFRAPPAITLNQLDDLLALVPAAAQTTRVIDLPPGTEHGFLLAVAGIIQRSASPCRAGDKGLIKAIQPVPYLYYQTLYDLSLTSCEYHRELHAKKTTFADVVEADFQIRNRVSHEVTKFQVDYGTADPIRNVPVRMVFRPRWWMEVELVLDVEGKHRP